MSSRVTNPRRRDFASTMLLSFAGACVNSHTSLAKENHMPPDSAFRDSGYAPVSGINMYYEIHGQTAGIPLVLCHGGGSTIEVTFGKVLPIIAQHRKVIALEEQAHGRTSDRNQPERFETSADDVAALLAYLKIPQADLLGFSNGAGVALQVAIRHPEMVRKLVFASFFTKRDGADAAFWPMINRATFANMPQPLKDAYLKVHPDPQGLRTMCEKDIERMRSFQDIPDEQLKSVRASTLIVCGDRDVMRPEHAVELMHLIPHSRLLIVPGAHGDYLGEILTAASDSHSPELFAGLIEEFLSAPLSPSAKHTT